MADQPEKVRTQDLPRRFEERFEDEVARGTARGRAAVVAFLDAATTELADWSPNHEGDDLLQCELSSDATKVHLGLIRSMAYRHSDGGWRFYTHFNLQTAFERPPDRPADSYAFVRVGDKGTETPEKLFEWLTAIRASARSSIPRHLTWMPTSTEGTEPAAPVGCFAGNVEAAALAAGPRPDMSRIDGFDNFVRVRVDHRDEREHDPLASGGPT